MRVCECVSIYQSAHIEYTDILFSTLFENRYHRMMYIIGTSECQCLTRQQSKAKQNNI